MDTWSQSRDESGSLADTLDICASASGATQAGDSARKSALWDGRQLSRDTGNSSSDSDDGRGLHFDIIILCIKEYGFY